VNAWLSGLPPKRTCGSVGEWRNARKDHAVQAWSEAYG
jgi:hypothetical protein